MLTITPAAKLRFQAITDVDIPEGWALRLDLPGMSHNGDTPGIAMYVGEPQEDDRPVEHEGETLLYVSGCVAEAYAGFVVDVEEAPEGLRFGLGPPEDGREARSWEKSSWCLKKRWLGRG